MDAGRLTGGGRGALRHPLEAVLLFGACVLLLVAIAATLRVALEGSGRTEDLTFAGTDSTLSRTLQINGPAMVARLDRATLTFGDDQVLADTLVLTADSASEPAAAKGGFIHDQAALFNDHAIRQAMLSSVSGDSGARVSTDGPSLLRTVWTEDGERRLSDRPNPYAMTVRSPYAERAWREVRTADWRRSTGLLGFEGDVALATDMPMQSQARLNGNDCTIKHDAPRILVYCKSAMASDIGLFFDLGFELVPGPSGGRFASAFAYRERNVWRNGKSETFGKRAVTAGDLLDAPWLGPILLSTSDRGTLAAGQWINGRATFANQRNGTVSFFSTVGRTVPRAPLPTPIVLGLDAALSNDLDREAARFVSTHRELARMSVVVVDVRSGEVKSISETGRVADGEPLLAFEPLLVGSIVKPMMASAILTRRPGLADMRIMYAGDTVRVVNGVPLQRGFANSANGCNGNIDFELFLARSSNQYAAELMLRSLEADGFTAQGRAGEIVSRETLERSSIANGLAEAFDVDAFGERTTGRNPSWWNPDSVPLAGEGGATSSRALVPWESRPWILFPDAPGTRVDLLARYAFGGWENRWTLMGVAEAYARIATGRVVHATFLRRQPAPGTSPRFPPSPPRVAAAFARVRGALRQVGVSGTVAGLTARLQPFTQERVTVLAKTGTLNETSGRFKSLVMAIGVPDGPDPTARFVCGLVVVSYFEFADLPQRATKRPPLPAVHSEFAKGPFASVLARHWRRVGGCPAVLDDGRGTREGGK